MSPLVELLHPYPAPGFPDDYLLARLARRRAVRLASCPAGTGEEARRELDRELDWFHGQLEPELRRQLAPVLLYFELPALLAALRFMRAMDRRALPTPEPGVQPPAPGNSGKCLPWSDPGRRP